MAPLGVNLSTVKVEFAACIINENLFIEKFNELGGWPGL
jgi:hypothetical protein